MWQINPFKSANISPLFNISVRAEVIQIIVDKYLRNKMMATQYSSDVLV